MFEKIPVDEVKQIKNIADLTIKQLDRRYTDGKPILRGVHAKGHGCVQGTFVVRDDLSEKYRFGVFAKPGKQYSVWARFSNANPLVTPDSPADASGARKHGSRGMAVKLLDVEGELLEPQTGNPVQDFLMINQPVFAFANVADYEVLSEVLLKHADDAGPFFAPLKTPPTPPTPEFLRIMETFKIVSRIGSLGGAGSLPPFQTPPATPVDNDYFGAAPFLLGPDQVMRYCVVPRSKSSASPKIDEENYLKTALAERFQDTSQGDVVFDFQVRVRPGTEIDPEKDIENASHDWQDASKFETVATLTLPLQKLATEDFCEQLVFSPWQGLAAHQPLGGINRLRRPVYHSSVKHRLATKRSG